MWRSEVPPCIGLRRHGPRGARCLHAGEEYSLLPQLSEREALCHISVATIEWHPKVCLASGRTEAWCNRTRYTSQRALERNCGGVLREIDDEFHSTDRAPWPAANSLCGRDHKAALPAYRVTPRPWNELRDY